VTSVLSRPQLSFTWRSSLSAQIGADLPISINNTALQVVPITVSASGSSGIFKAAIF